MDTKKLLFLSDDVPESTRIANSRRVQLYKEVHRINTIVGDNAGSKLLMDAAMVLISIAGDAVTRSGENE